MQKRERFLSPSQIEDMQERAGNKGCEEPFTHVPGVSSAAHTSDFFLLITVEHIVMISISKPS